MLSMMMLLPFAFADAFRRRQLSFHAFAILFFMLFHYY